MHPLYIHTLAKCIDSYAPVLGLIINHYFYNIHSDLPVPNPANADNFTCTRDGANITGVEITFGYRWLAEKYFYNLFASICDTETQISRVMMELPNDLTYRYEAPASPAIHAQTFPLPFFSFFFSSGCFAMKTSVDKSGSFGQFEQDSISSAMIVIGLHAV